MPAAVKRMPGLGCSHLLAAVPWLLAVADAGAFTAYVSNEKGNSVTVIDTEKMAAVKTIKVGQRPRGIEVTNDGRFVLVAVGDDDTIQMVDTKTAVKTGEPVPTLPPQPAGAHHFTLSKDVTSLSPVSPKDPFAGLDSATNFTKNDDLGYAFAYCSAGLDPNKSSLHMTVAITGGKATTLRGMAELCGDVICRKLGVDRPCSTRSVTTLSHTAFYAETERRLS